MQEAYALTLEWLQDVGGTIGELVRLHGPHDPAERNGTLSVMTCPSAPVTQARYGGKGLTACNVHKWESRPAPAARYFSAASRQGHVWMEMVHAAAARGLDEATDRGLPHGEPSPVLVDAALEYRARYFRYAAPELGVDPESEPEDEDEDDEDNEKEVRHIVTISDLPVHPRVRRAQTQAADAWDKTIRQVVRSPTMRV